MRIIIILLMLSFHANSFATFYEDVPINNVRYSYWIIPGKNAVSRQPAQESCHDYSQPIRVLIATPYTGCFDKIRYVPNMGQSLCTTKDGHIGFLQGMTEADINLFRWAGEVNLNLNHVASITIGKVTSIDKVGNDLFATILVDNRGVEKIREGYVYRSVEGKGAYEWLTGRYYKFSGLALTKTPVIRKQDALPQPCGLMLSSKSKSKSKSKSRRVTSNTVGSVEYGFTRK